MEGIFANCHFAQPSKWNVFAGVDGLSLSKGEGEGEGSFKARSQRSALNPSPRSSSLATRGEARRCTNRLPASHTTDLNHSPGSRSSRWLIISRALQKR